MSHDPISAAPSPHRPADELAPGLSTILRSPKERGTVELIVARPAEGLRQCLAEGRLTPEEGLVGDRWRRDSWRKLDDGRPDPVVQVTLMNARCIGLLAGDKANWAAAGDNLFVDLDLSARNLPVGSRLRVGTAVLEITEPPHTGCAKFQQRYGAAARAFVNSPEGKSLRLRGVHARVIEAGAVVIGDSIERC